MEKFYVKNFRIVSFTNPEFDTYEEAMAWASEYATRIASADEAVGVTWEECDWEVETYEIEESD